MKPFRKVKCTFIFKTAAPSLEIWCHVILDNCQTTDIAEHNFWETPTHFHCWLKQYITSTQRMWRLQQKLVILRVVFCKMFHESGIAKCVYWVHPTLPPYGFQCLRIEKLWEVLMHSHFCWNKYITSAYRTTFLLWNIFLHGLETPIHCCGFERLTSDKCCFYVCDRLHDYRQCCDIELTKKASAVLSEKVPLLSK